VFGAGLVVGQGEAKDSAGQLTIGPAEQQGSGGAIDGDRADGTAYGFRQLPAEVNQSGAPTGRVGKRLRVRACGLSNQLSMAIHHGEPDAAAAQINAEPQVA
jgi:hypothetical protein